MSRLSEEAWVKVPLKLLRAEGLTKSDAAICCVIIDRCSKRLEGWTEISTADMAADTGTATKTAKRAVTTLERLGLIEVQRTQGKQSAYRLTGCVELCPSAFRRTAPAAAPPARRSGSRAEAAPTEAERARASKYEALVNRFKDDEPLPGQLEFPRKGT